MSAPVPSETTKVASLELGVIARYSSTDQTLAVLAQLTRNSWLFSEDCRLTGGFAFMVWFAKPQVVLTVGGYGPLYVPPDYFPQVPELAFQWQVSDDVVIKGGTYYALTPQVMTVGGRLEAHAEFSAGHANVCVYADAALWFWPPYFVLDLGFRATGRICGFGFDVGCDVRIEVPPLWGEATVHFMGSHRFTFGTRRSQQEFLSELAEFVENFLGGAEQVHKLQVSAGALVSDTPPGAETTGGGQPAGTAADPWRVALEFTLATATTLPAVTATLNGTAVAGVAGGIRELYALPLNPDSARLDPIHEVQITRVDDGSAVPAERFGATSVRTGVPTGIYGVDGTGSFEAPVQGSDPTQGKSQLDVAIGGLQLVASTRVSSSTGAGVVTLAKLVHEVAAGELPLDPIAAPRRVHAAREKPAVDSPIQPSPPRMRWSTTGASHGPERARVALGETQLWELWHAGPPARLEADGALGRVVAADPMGRILHDGVVLQPATVPARTATLMLGAPDGAGAAGWEAGTRLLPVTRWVLVAPGATVELPTLGAWPAKLDEASGVPAERAVFAGCSGAATRFAADTLVHAVVVRLDARRPQARLGDLAVAVTGGPVGDPHVLRDERWGRLTLIYPLEARDAGEPLTVSVVVDTDAWVLAATVALRGEAADWLARLEAEPWTPLLAAHTRTALAAPRPARNSRRAAPAEPAAVDFRLVYPQGAA